MCRSANEEIAAPRNRNGSAARLLWRRLPVLLCDACETDEGEALKTAL